MRRLLLCLTVVVAILAPNAAFAASRTRASANYGQPNWFTWEKASLDVLIIPPNHGQIINGNGLLGGSQGGAGELTPANSYLRAVEKSVAAFGQAVQTYGSSWLKSGLKTNVYVVGRDAVPRSVLTDPEIVITSDEGKASTLGVALSSRPCIVDNSKFFVTSFTYADMYNINGQEYGHCLGLDHVEGGAPGDQIIAHDVMNGQYADSPGSAGTHLHCVSNLNVKGLEQTFAATLGRGPGGATVTMAPSSYRKLNC